MLLVVVLISCGETIKSKPFTSVKINTIYEDSISIRAIELMGNSLVFAANHGIFGTIALNTGKVRTNVQPFDSLLPEFRAVAHTTSDFFMLSTGNPALLYKTAEGGQMQLVYKEEGVGVFYDAMTFWNDKEGIAVGDSVNGCLSILITRDGGTTWTKLPCSELPDVVDGEGAFAASNTNIVVKGSNTYIATTSGRIYFSQDKGNTWVIQTTPVHSEKPTQGIYSMAFYDEHIGFAIGGDYTEPQSNNINQAFTKNGGKTWMPVASGEMLPYKSCVQFVPNAHGNGVVALGFTGISYSCDRGAHWNSFSEDAFILYSSVFKRFCSLRGRKWQNC